MLSFSVAPELDEEAFTCSYSVDAQEHYLFLIEQGSALDAIHLVYGVLQFEDCLVIPAF